MGLVRGRGIAPRGGGRNVHAIFARTFRCVTGPGDAVSGAAYGDTHMTHVCIVHDGYMRTVATTSIALRSACMDTWNCVIAIV